MTKSIGEPVENPPRSQKNSKRRELREATYIAIRAYLKNEGWRDFDEELLTENMGFVIDPCTGQNFPIDHAYTIQTTREIYESYLRE